MKKGRKDFQILKIQETKALRKVHRPGSMSGPAGPKTITLESICSPTKWNKLAENKQMALNDMISRM